MLVEFGFAVAVTVGFAVAPEVEVGLAVTTGLAIAPDVETGFAITTGFAVAPETVTGFTTLLLSASAPEFEFDPLLLLPEPIIFELDPALASALPPKAVPPWEFEPLRAVLWPPWPP